MNELEAAEELLWGVPLASCHCGPAFNPSFKPDPTCGACGGSGLKYRDRWKQAHDVLGVPVPIVGRT